MPNWNIKWSDHLKFQSATSSSSSKADLPAFLWCRTFESPQCFENVLENGAVNVDAVLDPIHPMPKLRPRGVAARGPPPRLGCTAVRGAGGGSVGRRAPRLRSAPLGVIAFTLGGAPGARGATGGLRLFVTQAQPPAPGLARGRTVF